MCILSVYLDRAYIAKKKVKVVGYYDLSVLSMSLLSVMGFQKKVWMDNFTFLPLFIFNYFLFIYYSIERLELHRQFFLVSIHAHYFIEYVGYRRAGGAAWVNEMLGTVYACLYVTVLLFNRILIY